MIGRRSLSVERILQWFDELDDLFGTIGLLVERMRRLVIALARLFIVLAMAVCGVIAAFTEPPLGSAIGILLFVFVLYRSVTQPVEFGHSDSVAA